jgi:chromate transport protein ChrA
VSPADPPRVSLATIALEWGRIGVTGFGGPPAHIAALRRLCVERHGWLSAQEFEDGIAATGLLPGPASTQLAIYCAWRLRGPSGALVGALCFVVPGLLVILGLSALFLEAHPPLPVLGAAAGAGAAVPAVALHAAARLLPASRRRAGDTGGWRWGCYLVAGGRRRPRSGPGSLRSWAPVASPRPCFDPTAGHIGASWRSHWGLGRARRACCPSAGWHSRSVRCRMGAVSSSSLSCSTTRSSPTTG